MIWLPIIAAIMKLIEILTQPYSKKCDCAGCISKTYLEMAHAIVGLESEALTVLNEPRLSEMLKLQTGSFTNHSKIRFSLLLSLVKDPKRKLIFLKNLIQTPHFDLELLDLKIIKQYNRNNQMTARDQPWIFRNYWSTDIDRAILNAPVFRMFPELIENKIVPYESQRTIRYVIDIYNMGMNQFKAYFGCYLQDDMILITHVLFEEYLKTKQEALVPLIQKAYIQISENRPVRFYGAYTYSYKELTNKILRESNHDCLPFETPNFGAKTLDEYHCYLDKANLVKRRINRSKIDFDSKLYRLESKISEYRKQIVSIENEIDIVVKILEHNEKSRKRLEELQPLADMHPLSRLEYVIKSERAIFYFPEFIFEDSLGYIEELTAEQRKVLSQKLSTAKRGILKKMKLYLAQRI